MGILKKQSGYKNILLQFSVFKVSAIRLWSGESKSGKRNGIYKNYIDFQRLRKEEHLIVDFRLKSMKQG
jgi:hypothetical protein